MFCWALSDSSVQLRFQEKLKMFLVGQSVGPGNSEDCGTLWATADLSAFVLWVCDCGVQNLQRRELLLL